MAEKPNCSDQKLSASTARRRASLPTLSRILKSQTSSFQHRASSSVKRKSSGGFKMFLVKTMIGIGAVYMSAALGVWGEPEESREVLNKIKRAISKIDNEKIMSGELKTELMDKINKSTSYIQSQLENIPAEAKATYEKTEKAVKEMIKGKDP